MKYECVRIKCQKPFPEFGSGKHKNAQQGVHPTGGSRRVFEQLAWLKAGSGKMALSPLAHQRVTHTVRCCTNKKG
jgi:hypothetical protein